VNSLGLERWQQLWRSLGAKGDVGGWYEILMRAYAEPQRHYHNQRHIADCLAEFDSVRSLAKQPEAVELALWFHDAVYDPKAADNEEQSAALAKCCLEAAGLRELAEVVARLIMTTKTHDLMPTTDAALLVDVDLSILGQSEARFAEYEAQIRAEYAWVAAEVFATKRTEILRRFLARPRIYITEAFFDRHEAQARRNLAPSIRVMSER
jgi:predicted metal-dependent HD superfamily phosphohydrolase